MNKIQQNFLYLAVIVILFLLSLHFFLPKENYKAHGVYIPNSKISFAKTNPSDVKVLQLKHHNEEQGSIGLIRVSIHLGENDNKQMLCSKNIQKAVDIAAQNGANAIQYDVCSYLKSKINQLSSASLKAYAFRDK